MWVQVKVEMDGREVELRHELSGSPAEREEEAHRLGRAVGRVVTEQALSEVAERVQQACCCGRRMENKGRRRITLAALDGKIRVARTRYRCRTCGRDAYVADGLLMCGVHRVTRPLAKRACQLATVEHFTELPRLLFDQHGVRISHQELIALVHDIGGTANELRRAEAEHWLATPADRRAWPEPDVTPPRVYVSCDGIMYCTNIREPDLHHAGTSRLVWQQMRVGCVYWQDARDTWHKEVIWGRETAEQFGANLFRLACRCGYRQASETIFAADGGDWCWEIRERYFGDAIGVLDWYHASEHLWDTAKVLHPDAPDDWAQQAQNVMWDEGGAGVLEWVRTLRPATRGRKRQAVDRLIGYIQARVGAMDYPTYRARGWQIGTGMIESTAKQLVGQRLKGPGMHWSEHGALAMTALRAQSLNHHWHRFWETLVLNI